MNDVQEDAEITKPNNSKYNQTNMVKSNNMWSTSWNLEDPGFHENWLPLD